MNEHAYEFADLLARHLKGELTASERSRFEQLLHQSPAYRELLEKMSQPGKLDEQLEQGFSINTQAAREKIVTRLFEQPKPAGRVVHRLHFLKTAWFRYAAILLFTIGLGTYLWNTQKEKEKPSLATTNQYPMQNNVAPGGNKAVLTLANGKTIALDDVASGQIARERGATIEKRGDGQLVYVSAKVTPVIVAYNTMTTPRGGQYQLVLPDGSRVWLNAASSITYPTAFSAATREVSITGECYFEVTRNTSKPFVVKTSTDVIEVLGTHFNVNAYADETSVKTSLLEGSVKVGSSILKPGQAFTNGRVTQTNTEQDVAWKNGVFNFEGLNFQQAMRQLSRWYDIDVQYADGAPQKGLFGEMDRGLTLQQVLEGLQSPDVRFELNNRTLKVIAK